MDEFSNQDIIDECLTFLYASWGTTSSLISFAMYHMCKFPEYQQKLYEEIQQNIKGDEITYSDIKNLKFLSYILNETLRLFPPLLMSDRITWSDVYTDEIIIPKDSNFSINILSIHTNPNVWKNPLQFDPDRWSEERIKEIELNYNFIPFSNGNRACIAKDFALIESSIVISMLIKKFQIQFIDESFNLRVHHNYMTISPLDLGITLKLRN